MTGQEIIIYNIKQCQVKQVAQEVICVGDQCCLHPIVRIETGLEETQEKGIIQKNLKLFGDHSINYFTMDLRVQQQYLKEQSSPLLPLMLLGRSRRTGIS